MTKSIDELKNERRDIDRRIKAQIRAEQRRQKEELLSARQELGLWLTEAVGADTLDLIATVRAFLGTDKNVGAIRKKLAEGDGGEPTADAADEPDGFGPFPVEVSSGSVMTHPSPAAPIQTPGSSDRAAPDPSGSDAVFLRPLGTSQ